jgi:hypothetical protein
LAIGVQELAKNKNKNKNKLAIMHLIPYGYSLIEPH